MKWRVWRSESTESLVARDGIEPPTPAFSGMSDQQLTGNPLRKHKTYSTTIWTPFGLQGVFGWVWTPHGLHNSPRNLEVRLLSRARLYLPFQCRLVNHKTT